MLEVRNGLGTRLRVSRRDERLKEQGGLAVRKNQVIRNDETGESLTMLESEYDNGGKRQVYRVELPPHRPSPPLHYHVAFPKPSRW